MPVSIHHQYYLGEGPATRYYRGLERRADFIMVPRERENRRMECGMVGWLALGSCVEVRSVESIAGAWRLSRVYKARDRMLGRRNACERAAHTHIHALEKLTRSRAFSTRVAFSGRGNFLGDLRPVCFPVAPMAEFSLRRCDYYPSNAPTRNACARVLVSRNVGFREYSRREVSECPTTE